MKNAILGLIAVAIFAALPAHAKPHERQVRHEKGALDIAISIADRMLIKDYLRNSYGMKRCPPGLAKKNNGCLPPGLAKKYAMGRPLPPGIAKQRLPGGLMSQLHPIPGYQFVQVDKDVLLISEATQKVVDAVTLLSAVK